MSPPTSGGPQHVRPALPPTPRIRRLFANFARPETSGVPLFLAAFKNTVAFKREEAVAV